MLPWQRLWLWTGQSATEAVKEVYMMTGAFLCFKNVEHAKVVDTNGSGHGALAGFLMQHGVDTLVCGGIGGGAQAALAEAGIKLYGGVSGDADAAVSALLSGNLGYNPNVHCDHHDHKHGEEGHTCGDHGCGKHSCH